MAPQVSFNDFSFRYSAHAKNAVRSLTTTIPAGICCALLGPTGAGKTTLLHALSGLLGKNHSEGVASGEIIIGEHSYKPLPKTILFPEVGLALQDPYVQISGIRATVSEEIAFTLENLAKPASAMENELMPFLRTLGVGHLSQRKPTELSGGELQRVALATILVAQPTLLLLDEPTSALDNLARSNLKHVLKTFKKKATIIFADTQLDFAIGLADIFLIMAEGKAVFAGNQMELLNRLEEFKELLPVTGWSQTIHRLKASTAQQDRAVSFISKSLSLK